MSHAELMEIYLHLKDVLKQLSKAPITVEFSDSSLQKDLINLESILQTHKISDHSKTLIGMINETTESLLSVINLRANIKSQLDIYACDTHADSFSALSTEHQDITTRPDNIDLQEMTNDLLQTPDVKAEEILICDALDSQQPMLQKDCKSKSKRLPKHIVEVLNCWYEENIDYPYLTKEDIIEINLKTGLSDNQIKNWASNRRRKKKEAYISPELQQLLL